MACFWLSSVRMTVYAECDEDQRVIECSPIIRVFTGQRLSSLIEWMSKQEGFGWETIDAQGYRRAIRKELGEAHAERDGLGPHFALRSEVREQGQPPGGGPPVRGAAGGDEEPPDRDFF